MIEKETCSVCNKKADCIYKFGDDIICYDCYTKIFNGDYPAEISKFLKKNRDKVVELNQMLNSYHEICVSYEKYIDKVTELRHKDIKDIEDIIKTYTKGIGLKLYNERIKPIMEHIKYIDKRIDND